LDRACRRAGVPRRPPASGTSRRDRRMIDLVAVDPAVVCSALGPLLLPERRARIDATVSCRLAGLRVVLEDLHDPHDGAAVLRSLNLSVAAAVVASGAAALRRRALGAAGDLDVAARIALRARFCAADVRRPEAVLQRFLSAKRP